MPTRQPFAHFQQPFLDLRALHPHPPQVLGFLNNTEYAPQASVKHFGALTRRHAPTRTWPGENTYFQAKNALKAPSIARDMQLIFAPAGRHPRFYACRTRRLFLSDYPVMRLEISLELTDWSAHPTTPARDTARSVGKQTFRFKDQVQGVPLCSRAFRDAATSLLTRATAAPHPNPAPLRATEPTLIIEYPISPDGPPALPPTATDGTFTGPWAGLRLTHFRQTSADEAYGVWLIGLPTHPEPTPALRQAARDLRIGLLKLHAHLEGTRQLLAHMHLLNPDETTDAIRSLESTLDILAGFQWGAWPLHDTHRLVLHAYDLATHGLIKETISHIQREVTTEKTREDRRRQHTATIVNYGALFMTRDDHSVHVGPIENSQVAIGRNLKLGDFILNLNTNADQATTQEQIKTQLKTVNNEVGRIIEQLPEDKRAEAIDYLENLNQQATKPKPTKGLLDVSAKGLLEAAGAVASIISGPAITAITALMKLFP